MPTTVYDVSTRYALDVKGEQDLKRLGHTADGTWHSLKRLGEVFLIGEAFKLGKEFLVDANAEMQKMNISTAAMLQGNHIAKSFEDAQFFAHGLVEEYQKFAMTSPLTTREVTSFGQGITAATAQAGGTLEDIKTLAEQGAAAAKTLGAEAGYAALELTEGIQRGVNARMRFLKQLLAFADVSDEKFKAMGEHARMKVLEKAVTSQAMQRANLAMGKSWEGVSSTFIDNLEIGLRKVGVPLTEELTKTLGEVNHWLDTHEETVKGWVHDLGEGLRSGFTYAKEVVGFIVQNKDTLLTLGKLWLATKIAGGVGSFMQGGAGGLIGMLTGQTGAGLLGKLALGQNAVVGAAGTVMLSKALNNGTGELQDFDDMVGAATGALAMMPGQIGLIGKALVALHLGAEATSTAFSDSDHERGDRQADREGLYRALTKQQDEATGRTAAFLFAQRHGALITTGEEDKQGLDSKRLRDVLYSLEDGVGPEQTARVERMTKLAERAIGGMGWEQWDRLLKRGEAEAKKDPVANAPMHRGEMNVHIGRIEVASDNPDRFVFRLSTALRRARRNPSLARDAIAGAF